MSFTVLKSRLALETFNGMVSGLCVHKQEGASSVKVPKPKFKLPKPKPEGYQKPSGSDPDRDPESGGYREGTKRQWKSGWHIKMEGDWLPYRPDKNQVFVEGEGWKDADKQAKELGISLKKPKEEKKPTKPTKKSDKKPEIRSDIERLKEDLGSDKISLDQAKSSTRELMHRMGEKFREMQGKASDPDQKKKLSSVADKARAFADKRREALENDDRKMLEEAVAFLDSIAEELGETAETPGKTKREKPGNSGKSVPKEYLYEKAALSDAPWEGKISDIEKAVATKTKNRTFVSGEGNQSAVFFDETEGGAKVAYKPEGFGDPPETKRITLRKGPTAAEREVASFYLDRLFGFGIVPPTFHRASDVSFQDKRSFTSETGKLVDVDSEEAEGSAQLFVEGSSVGKDGVYLKDRYKKMSDQEKLDVQKMAVFDYITGNTDRHHGNIMAEEGHVYAIDNGLSFPKEGDLGQLKSEPLRVVQHYGGSVNPKIIEQLKKVDRNLLKKVMSEQNLAEEADSVLQRLDRVLESRGDLSSKEFTPRRPLWR